jgi:hypothetical protein
MADNVDITPGSGATVATDDIGGVNYQRVKIAHGGDGTATDTSDAAPFPTAVISGELVEATQALRAIANMLTGSIGRAYADDRGRLQVFIGGGTAAGVTTVSTVTTVTGVTTLSTLTNQTQIGGINAAPQIPALMQLGADSLRRNISTS